MSDVVAIALLALGTACELVCVAGVLWFRDGFDQLHFAGAASTVGVVAVAAAAVLTGFPTASGTIECVVALALLFVLGPVLVAATGRAGRLLRTGDLVPARSEHRAGP
jgi:multisubunit Na+/H+ antiporter MnhG subunit